MAGKFSSFNLYQTTFEPQCLLDFQYLIIVIIGKGSPKIFKFLDVVLHPIGFIADRDILEGSWNY